MSTYLYDDTQWSVEPADPPATGRWDPQVIRAAQGWASKEKHDA